MHGVVKLVQLQDGWKLRRWLRMEGWRRKAGSSGGAADGGMAGKIGMGGGATWLRGDGPVGKRKTARVPELGLGWA